MSVKYKLHQDTTTIDVSIRISAIANGWVIKAGCMPHHCASEEEVVDEISRLVKDYLKETRLLSK